MCVTPVKEMLQRATHLSTCNSGSGRNGCVSLKQPVALSVRLCGIVTHAGSSQRDTMYWAVCHQCKMRPCYRHMPGASFGRESIAFMPSQIFEPTGHSKCRVEEDGRRSDQRSDDMDSLLSFIWVHCSRLKLPTHGCKECSRSLHAVTGHLIKELFAPLDASCNKFLNWHPVTPAAVQSCPHGD